MLCVYEIITNVHETKKHESGYVVLLGKGMDVKECAYLNMIL